MEGWTDRQTDCCRAAKLLAPGRKAAVNQRKGWLSFFGTCLSGPEENSMKEGEDMKTLLFPPPTVYRALREM
ncbi:hypothetical protein OYC64_003074 [Pagothenia borchgrevinki]|uniref:Uncharacterized protein n=1 Tax=Pagothenia borchgrevinki TaxID=8213 RepID=A0ABD2HAQ9_PAGBO